MGKRFHRPCPWRTRRKFDNVTREYCTAMGDHPPEAPFCEYCKDRIPLVKKTSKSNRKAKK